MSCDRRLLHTVMWLSLRPNLTTHEFPLCHDHRGSRDPETVRDPETGSICSFHLYQKRCLQIHPPDLLISDDLWKPRDYRFQHTSQNEFLYTVTHWRLLTRVSSGWADSYLITWKNQTVTYVVSLLKRYQQDGLRDILLFKQFKQWTDSGLRDRDTIVRQNVHRLLCELQEPIFVKRWVFPFPLLAHYDPVFTSCRVQ